jgi:hypothetical protein
VTDLDGNFLLQVGGGGEEGLTDGSFEKATFTYLMLWKGVYFGKK